MEKRWCRGLWAIVRTLALTFYTRGGDGVFSVEELENLPSFKKEHSECKEDRKCL